MTRFLKRFVFALATLGLGALAYALLRAEGERSLRPARAEGTGGEPPPVDHEPAGAPGPAPAADVSPNLCAATTKSGVPCRRQAEPGSEFCWQHAP